MDGRRSPLGDLGRSPEFERTAHDLNESLQMNEHEMTTRSRRSLAAFLFSILFVVHVMLIPVWLGISAIMTLGQSTNNIFEIVPAWFFGTGTTCLILALVLHYFPKDNQSATRNQL